MDPKKVSKQKERYLVLVQAIHGRIRKKHSTEIFVHWDYDELSIFLRRPVVSFGELLRVFQRKNRVWLQNKSKSRFFSGEFTGFSVIDLDSSRSDEELVEEFMYQFRHELAAATVDATRDKVVSGLMNVDLDEYDDE